MSTTMNYSHWRDAPSAEREINFSDMPSKFQQKPLNTCSSAVLQPTSILTDEISPQLQDQEPTTTGENALEPDSSGCPALPMFYLTPLIPSSVEVPPHQLSSATSQNSLELVDVQLGYESCAKITPGSNSRDCLTRLRRLMKALFSRKPRQSSIQSSPEQQDLGVNGKDTHQPNSRGCLTRLRRRMKALFSAKSRKNSRQSSPEQQDLWVNGKDTPKSNSTDCPALPRRVMKSSSSAELRQSSRQNSFGPQDLRGNDKDTISFGDNNEPFWGIPRIIYGTTNQNSSELHYHKFCRISYDDEIPRDISNNDCPVSQGKCCSMLCWQNAS